jgi:hypothetical protein
MAKPINQGPPQGAYEPRVLDRGGEINQVPMGNRKARDVGGGGPGKGYDVYRSGGQHGLSDPSPARSEGELFPGFPGRR